MALINDHCQTPSTGLDVTVAKSSANGLVGTGFVCRYRLQPRADYFFKDPVDRY